MKAEACIANFINGNLTDATRQARSIRAYVLLETLQETFGKSEQEALAISFYLKNPSQTAFDAACQAGFAAKDAK